MFSNVLLIIIYLFAPAGVLWLCSRSKVLGKIGPVLLLYLIGIVLGNTFHPSWMGGVQEILSNATIPVAIPLMLFGCTFHRSQTRSQVLALITGLLAVTISVVAGFFIFRNSVPEAEKVAGMLTGVYTGGTINMASLKTIVGASDADFVVLNSCDMVVCFLYLTFLMSAGIRLFRRILPTDSLTAPSDAETGDAETFDKRKNPFRGILTREGLKEAGLALGVTAVAAGVSAGVALLIGPGLNMTVFFLILTTLGIAASFIRKVHDTRYSYDMGMYLIYIFSIVVSSMADFRELDLSAGLGMLGYLSLVIFGSLLLQVVFAMILRIDSDTMVISSVTYICSPPFVPMISATMRNRSILACGLTIGVIGYAVGNYLGFAIFKLLSLL